MYGFVVEGFHDENRVKEILPGAMFVVTKGTRLNNRVKQDIDQLIKLCEKVFILTDPDDAGEQLAKMIQAVYPDLTRIPLYAKECMCYRQHKVKIGVEHYPTNLLKERLSPYMRGD